MKNEIKHNHHKTIFLIFSLFIILALFSSTVFSNPNLDDITQEKYKDMYINYYGKIEIEQLLRDMNKNDDFCNDTIKTQHESLKEYLTIDLLDEEKSYADVALTIDNSKSMIGYKMTNAKTAAINLIDIIDDNDRISIFTFSNNSILVSDFSSDKENLKSSIYSIDIGESTFYGTSLENIFLYIEEHKEEKNSKSIIFISDGAPKDDETEIYSIVEGITQNDICIITIGYGEELKDSYYGANILQNIANISKKNTGCGSYLYSPTETDSFANILKKAYDESRQDNAKIKISYNIENQNITMSDELRITAKIKSDKNNLKVPGKISDIDGNAYCSEKMQLFFILQDQNNKSDKLVFSFTFNQKDEEYQLSLNSLPNGTYNSYIMGLEDSKSLDIKKRSELWIDEIKWINNIENLDRVIIHDNKIGAIINSGKITINNKKNGYCANSNCITLQEYIFSKNEVKDISITKYGFVPEKIEITDGTTVRWTNNDNKIHSIIITENNLSEIFPSKTLEPKETYSIYFPKAGRIRYYDNISNSNGNVDKDDMKIISINDFVIQYKNTLNFIILIDRSGSMYDKGKLDEIKRASNNLFDKIYYDDRVAVISFSEDAKIVHEFTNNITSLKNSVNRIVPDDTTIYISGLDEVETMFSKNNIKEGKIVLLLTDGMPWDEGKPDSIYKKTKELVDDGICVYAVGYGIPPEEKEAHKILTNIVKISKESTNCGNYSYVESDEKELRKVFGDIYYKEIGDIPALSIVSNINNVINKDKETLNVKLEIKSRINNRKIPGQIVVNNNTICSAPALVNYTIMKNQKMIMSGNIDYIGQGYDYYKEIDVKKLRTGEYQFLISARALCEEGQSSNFVGFSQNTITIIGEENIASKYLIFIIIGVILLFGFLVGLILLRNRRYS